MVVILGVGVITRRNRVDAVRWDLLDAPPNAFWVCAIVLGFDLLLGDVLHGLVKGLEADGRRHAGGFLAIRVEHNLRGTESHDEGSRRSRSRMEWITGERKVIDDQGVP